MRRVAVMAALGLLAGCAAGGSKPSSSQAASKFEQWAAGAASGGPTLLGGLAGGLRATEGLPHPDKVSCTSQNTGIGEVTTNCTNN